MNAKIDARTMAVAKIISNKNGHADNYAWEIEGGGFIPAWAMYVSEATKAIAQADLIVQVGKTK
jgi:hypothetical protein